MEGLDKYKIEQQLQEIREAIKVGESKKQEQKRSTEREMAAASIADNVKAAVTAIAEKLKPIFEESGKGLEVVVSPNPKKFLTGDNFVEVLYYPQSSLKAVRGVNTAALRFEFHPREGNVKLFKRESVFPIPLQPFGVMQLDESSIQQLSKTTLDFAKNMASK